MSRIVPLAGPRAIRMASELLRHGELVVVPTDTVYGVAAMPAHETVRKLYAAKRRPDDKPVPLLLSDAEVLPHVARRVAPAALTLAEQFWPGALTLVVEGTEDLPRVLGSSDGTIAVRVPNLDPLQQLLRSVGGVLAVTSANLSGQADARTAEEAAAAVGDHVALVLDGGPSLGGVPSTVVDATQDPPRVLRAGALADQLTPILASLT